MLTLQVIACIGIITGAFLLFHIRLNDFTGIEQEPELVHEIERLYAPHI